jgi:hypothetical protein
VPALIGMLPMRMLPLRTIVIFHLPCTIFPYLRRRFGAGFGARP